MNLVKLSFFGGAKPKKTYENLRLSGRGGGYYKILLSEGRNMVKHGNGWAFCIFCKYQ